MNNIINDYPKIHQIYSKEVYDIFDDEIYIQEKIDGSQISFKLTPDRDLLVKSKSVMLNYKDGICLSNNNFTIACQQIESIKDKLLPNWTYRGEYLKTPRHNKLHYGRIPTNNIVIYDIQSFNEQFLPPNLCEIECKKMGIEYAPILFHGKISRKEAMDKINEILKTESFLGKAIIEGVVIKNYEYFGETISCKVVREDFKEVKHVKERIVNQSDLDVIELAKQYATNARYEKAIQYLNDSDTPLSNSMTDIPKIIERVARDVIEEEGENIKDQLLLMFNESEQFAEYENKRDAIFKTYWKVISKRIASRIGNWYKAELTSRIL